ncbi:hypothetical protein SLS53_006183 [Cytospora paraplurivora]|uniref:Uncharacterized protein n=1 Tax=Cytospora paraplurivora TaxID=2898453 RepID=A0AAN9YF28_9PEZI
MDMKGYGTWKNLVYNCLGRNDTKDQSTWKCLGEFAAGLPSPFLVAHHPGALPKTYEKRPRRPSPIPGEPAMYEKDTAPVEDERDYDNAWHEMLESLHNALKHTYYAVSGRMAMTAWGCDRRARDAMSIICPIDSKAAAMIWAVSTGGRSTITDAEPDIWTFQAQSSSSKSFHGRPYIWRIGLRWVPEKVFEKMPQIGKILTYGGNPHTGEYRTACVNNLTLPAILDNCASAWADNLAKGALHERLEAVAEDIFSILDRIKGLNTQ